MKYHIFKNADEVGKTAAIIFSNQVLKKKDSVLGLATGSTPIPAYQHIVRMHHAGLVDYSQVTTYNLDEYCGLSQDMEQSYSFFMRHNLFRHINIPKHQIHVPNGMALDIKAECENYESSINASGGIDLQLLGIGMNGHVGFNEPCDSYVFETHQVALTQSTIEANKRFFPSASDVPRYAITMGIGTIMNARAIVLVATGKSKAEPIRNMLRRDPSPYCPASVLRFHPNATLLLDEEAASLL
ncbi:MAG: glucosamine-6-phosphate deaminase [Christensenellales bacterium]|jgi:glucosamine-6-phosphate deaminase